MFIYKITNKINGKQYVGKTVKPILKRFISHCNSAKGGSNQIICRAIKKYGKDSFLIEQIDTASTEKELFQKEIEWIKKLDTYNNGYNMTLGGEGQSGRLHSIETKLKMSKERRGRKVSEETKARLRLLSIEYWNKNRGRKSSEETKAKISKNRTGINLGFKHSEEAKIKMSVNRSGIKPSSEVRAKMRAAKLGKKKTLQANGTYKYEICHSVEPEKQKYPKMSAARLGRKKTLQPDGSYKMQYPPLRATP